MLRKASGQARVVYSYITNSERKSGSGKSKGNDMKKMKSLNQGRRQGFSRISALVLGGALVAGGLVWAANEHPGSAKRLESHAAPTTEIKPSAALANPKGMSFAPIVKKVAPSVVRVAVMSKARLTANEEGSGGWGLPDLPNNPFFRRFFGDEFGNGSPRQPMRMPPQKGEGSGVIVSKDGYILTNNHVVDNADEVKVFLQDGREFDAKVVGRDPKTDVAVLHVKASDLPAIPIADSDQVEVGDVVLAVGNPFGIGQTVTMGMVSAKGRAPLGLDYEDFIQTDAAINPGNSGGALVDTEGRLIGINTAILSRSGGNQGIGFAIPANLANEVMTSLVKNGHVIRGYLGVTIQDVNPALAKEFKLKEREGALVSDVLSGGPGAKSGLASGDVITDFNGRKVTDSRQLKLRVAETRPGESVPVKVLRNGDSVTLQVKVGELPGEERVIQARHESASHEETLKGVGVADLTHQNREQFKVPEKIQGALITSVEEDSAAANAGLKAGDVILEINRQKVNGASEAVNLTEKAKDKVTLVRVWSHGGIRYVVVDESKEKAS
jgi:serine protease Do